MGKEIENRVDEFIKSDKPKNITDTDKKILDLIATYDDNSPVFFLRGLDLLDCNKSTIMSNLAMIKGDGRKLLNLLNACLRDNEDIEKIMFFAIKKRQLMWSKEKEDKLNDSFVHIIAKEIANDFFSEFMDYLKDHHKEDE